MVAPLIIGAARVAGTAAVRTAGRSRIARATALHAERTGVSRFTQSQSLSARAASRSTPSPLGDIAPVRTKERTSRTRLLSKIPRSLRDIERLIENEDEDELLLHGDPKNPAVKALRYALGLRRFFMILPVLVKVSILIPVFSIFGLIAIFGAETLRWGTFSVVDITKVGHLFLGLAFVATLIAYVALLLFLMVMRRIHPLEFPTFHFLLFVFLPVFDLIPGLNIFPWFVLWGFVLCTAPKT
ncbi:hypothetical protein A3C89_02260 [Candidatus Kaiserbacteria bacterium RIFCSPHIGHO2_02_FULL_50_50]|uniref:Uncharacterized protein n=1 Tax=Candidatus Kaiserbacteria bacterium RIFCSPHIGHO2_02_FULL_50_50 TaxID=1798492 RepID=A0A1F6DFI6_9BACT|nr:MAG: hypothetical protein A3C89_02260 [Candidatus Kaiserbacteria bacterium RIFCSPHIGHO2_02_FULL_50_50]OGG88621.1 MAG: hypothetical protein A3G62_00805 [Candidatus Kaiserbacteria bacterium RIFCSPLOWO2_12_FULL_50_10]